MAAEDKAIFVDNTPTFLDELQDPNQAVIDPDALSRFEVPVCLTTGSASAPMFARVVDRLLELIPGSTHESVEGAGHLPQTQTPDRYVEVITRVLQQNAAT
jgi:pimeloyl-ACP methyl ester carboxylesterase